MSVTKHTPGPWNVEPAKGTLCAWAIATKLPTRPCIAFVAQTIGNHSEEDANARLIAAAPELLEALTVTRGQWIHSVNKDICLAAIAKATEGKQT